MAAISFKSVGETTEKRVQDSAALNAEKLPLGIVTPVRAGDEAEGIFKMHRNLADQIQDNLRNLLLTNHGDRVIAYDFGANLEPLTFEVTSQEDFDNAAMQRIKRAVTKYMPFVQLVDFESSILFPNENLPTGRTNMRITYDVPQAGLVGKSITVTFFLGG